jgi:hypothetical protein
MIDLSKREVEIRRHEINVAIHKLTEEYGEIKAELLGLENQEAALNRELAELMLYEAVNWPTRGEGAAHGG